MKTKTKTVRKPREDVDDDSVKERRLDVSIRLSANMAAYENVDITVKAGLTVDASVSQEDLLEKVTEAAEEALKAHAKNISKYHGALPEHGADEPTTVDEEEEEDDEKPKKKKGKAADDDDDDWGSDEEEEEDDEKPKKKKKSSKDDDDEDEEPEEEEDEEDDDKPKKKGKGKSDEDW